MSAAAGTAPRPSVLEALHEEEALGKAYDARLLRRLWRWVAAYRGQVALTLLLVAPMFVLEIAPAWIVKTGIDRVIAPAVHGAAPAAPGGWADRLFVPPAGLPTLVWLGLL